MSVPNREIERLLSVLDEAYDRAAWHGPNLRGSIRGLAPREAAKRVRPGRHNIWEIVVHDRPVDRSEKAWRQTWRCWMRNIRG